MEGFVFAAALCLAGMAAAALAGEKGRGLLLAVTGDGDEDMKIASPGSFSRNGASEEAELAAQKYLKLKSTGNIDKARSLGERFAAVLLQKEAAIRAGVAGGLDPLCMHHQLVLYSYVVNRVISDLSPDPLLAQTSLNVFYEQMEEISPDLYRHISDMAAFSLYILCERGNRSQGGIGSVYARLCEREGDAAVREEGDSLYEKFYALCAGEVQGIGYSAI